MAHHSLFELLAPRTRRARDQEYRTLPAKSSHDLLGTARSLLGLQEIRLVDRQPALLRRKIRREFLELRNNGAGALHRIGVGIRRRDVDEMQEHPRALQMPQEADPEAR